LKIAAITCLMCGKSHHEASKWCSVSCFKVWKTRLSHGWRVNKA